MNEHAGDILSSLGQQPSDAAPARPGDFANVVTGGAAAAGLAARLKEIASHFPSKQGIKEIASPRAGGSRDGDLISELLAEGGPLHGDGRRLGRARPPKLSSSPESHSANATDALTETRCTPRAQSAAVPGEATTPWNAS